MTDALLFRPDGSSEWVPLVPGARVRYRQLHNPRRKVWGTVVGQIPHSETLYVHPDGWTEGETSQVFLREILAAERAV